MPKSPIQSKSRIAAAGLVEIMVVLAMIATSLVAVVGINVRSQLLIKTNETIENANGVMLKALELARSPEPIRVTSFSGGQISNVAGKYSVVVGQDGNVSSIIKQLDADPTISANSFNCLESSAYAVSIDLFSRSANGAPSGNASNALICAQVIVSPTTSQLGENAIYEVNSIVVYPTPQGKQTNNLIGYRRGEFVVEQQ